MTTKRKRRGTIVLDRIVPVVGRIKRASGTDDKTTFKYINAMITTLQDLARFDILELIQRGDATPVEIYYVYRRKGVDHIPVGRALLPLRSSWEKWLAKRPYPEKSKQDIGYTIAAIAAGDDTQELRVADLPTRLAEVLEEKASTPRMCEKMKAHAQAFLKGFLRSRSHPLYVAVQDLDVATPKRKRKVTHMTPDEAKAFITSLPMGGPDAWTLCITGMLPDAEYAVEGGWDVRADRIEIHGTKRGQRERVIPIFGAVTLPSVHPKTLQDTLRAQPKGKTTPKDLGNPTPKDFRNFFARWMREAGISSLNRKFYMGHGTLTMTEHYEHGEFPGQLAADAAKFRAFVGEDPVF